MNTSLMNQQEANVTDLFSIHRSEKDKEFYTLPSFPTPPHPENFKFHLVLTLHASDWDGC